MSRENKCKIGDKISATYLGGGQFSLRTVHVKNGEVGVHQNLKWVPLSELRDIIVIEEA